MTDRIVKVVLRGEVQDFIGGMRASSSAVKATVNSMADGSKESRAFRQNLTAVGDTAGRIGLVAAGGVAFAVKKFADFDQAIAEVAATGDDARGSLDALRQAALDAGADTQYSATEAAGAIENLAKAGLTAQQILDGGLSGALNLAAAGGLEVADAAQIAAVSMKQFGLEGSQVPHVADLLAAGAGRAVGDVSDLGAALSQAGLVANQTGLTIEETTAALSAFASAGLLGSDSGTSLKALLQALTPASKAAATAIEQYNLSAYDQQGNFIGLEKFAGKLKTGLSGLSAEQRNATLKTIFGSDAVRAASVLYSEGATGIRDWTKAVDDQGYAAEVAAIRTDTLKGDVERLGGAFETAFIGTGQGANGPIRELVQLLTALVDGYNAIPGPLKTVILAAGGLAAAIGGTVFVASRALNAYANTRESLTGLGDSFDGVNKKALAVRGGLAAAGAGLAALSGPAHNANEQLGDLTDIAAAAALGFAVGGPWGAALGGGIAALSSLGGSSKVAKDQLDALTDTLDKQTGAITANTSAGVTKTLQDSGAADTLRDMGLSLATLTDAALGNSDALKLVKEQYDAIDRNGGLTDVENYTAKKKALESVLALTEGLEAGRQKQLEANEVGDQSVETQKAMADAAADTETQIRNLTDALDGMLDPLLNQDQASNAWKDSLASLAEAVEETGTSLDDNTVKGRANQDAIRERVQALKDSVAADAEAGVGQEELARKLLRGRNAILDAGEAAGFSRGEMKKYLAQLGLTPSQIKTLIKAETDDAKIKLRAIKAALDVIKDKNVTVRVTRQDRGSDAGKEARAERNGGAIARAVGGSVVGPGSGTSDSISAIGPGGAAYLLSNGEHIFTADEVNKMGGQSAVYALRQQIRNGQRYATGGAVNVAAPNVNVDGGMSATQFEAILQRAIARGQISVGAPINQRLALNGA